MPKNLDRIRKRIAELRPDYGVLVAKRMAEKEHMLERLSDARFFANSHETTNALVEVIDILREIID